ncbi:hypothetical protein [Spirosoma flavum]|uniref:Uncharacterized protein n=1 Tax=Spirosoma flavum TaxID=2048557 RepID=A0ABW6AV21_9BACT
MILFFTISYRQKGIKTFSIRPFSLETGLDYINYMTGQPDDQLISVYMVDNEVVSSIPVAAFDGEAFSKGIQELEQVWKALLPKPVSGKRRVRKAGPKSSSLAGLGPAQEPVDQLVEQIHASETQMVQQTLSLSQLSEFHQWALIESLPSRSQLLESYQNQIVLLKEQMSQSTTYHAQLTGRLDELLGKEIRRK